MKKLTAFSFVALLFPLFSSAQQVSYNCKPSKIFSPAIQVKNDKIFQIKSISFPTEIDPSKNKVDIVMSVTTMVDEMNAHNKKVKPKDITASFKVKEMKSGSLFELDTAEQNEAKLDALFLEIGNFDVQTAGPVPNGTYPMKVSLGLVSSQFSMTGPMLLKKIVLDCSVSVQN